MSCLTGGDVGYYVPYETTTDNPSGNCKFNINDEIEDMNNSNRYKCNLVKNHIIGMMMILINLSG